LDLRACRSIEFLTPHPALRATFSLREKHSSPEGRRWPEGPDEGSRIQLRLTRERNLADPFCTAQPIVKLQRRTPKNLNLNLLHRRIDHKRSCQRFPIVCSSQLLGFQQRV